MMAAREAVHLLAHRTHATGGLILLDREGHPGFAFNTPRMAYGYVAPDGSFVTCGVAPLPTNLLTPAPFKDSLAPNTPALLFASEEVAHASSRRSLAPDPALRRDRLYRQLHHAYRAAVP